MRPFRLISVFVLSALWSITITGSSFADSFSALVRNNTDGSQTLTGHVPLEVKNATAKFHHHASSSQSIDARIILPFQNQTQLSALLKDLYDTKSPGFRQFLTPGQFTQQFTASTIDTKEIQEFLNKQGISVTSQSPNGTVLKATGPVAAFEQALGLHINYYQKTDGTMFFAPDAEPTIPAPLAGKILAVGGLDNLAKYRPHFHQVLMKAANTTVGAVSGGNSAAKPAFGTGPGGFLAPNDVKTAYNLNSVPSNGSGQNMALFELDGYSSADITAYDAQFGIPGVPLQTIFVDGFNGTPDYTQGAPEVTLDIELMTAFAPGSSNIFVYEAPNTTQSWIDEWNQIASDDKTKIISCSWGIPELDSPTISSDNMIFQQMAAQGQAVFVAAGDSGAYAAGGNTLEVEEPAAQPYVTAVGISVLLTNSDGTYNSEWASVQGGGGISVYQSIPFYQIGAAALAQGEAQTSLTNRNLPDVALTADPGTGYSFYINGSWGGWWGSSLSSPIWASFMSCLNQGLGTNGPLGFANPTLYQIGQSGSYTNDFHEIVLGSNGYYPAVPGYNDATGLGSFNGLNLYNDLINQFSSSPSAPTGLIASVSIAQPEVVLSWNTSRGATSYNVKRATVSGGPYTTIASLVTNAAYIDTPAINGAAYYYVVSAVNAAGQSANSAQVSATPVLPPLPSIPTGLKATAQFTQVALTWTATTGAASYNIKRATVSGGPYTTIGSLVSNTYTDSSVSNGIAYYYVVSAVNAAGQSANSAQVSATPVTPPSSTAPVGLTATAGSAQVALSWTASTGAISYNIKRATVNGGPYTIIASVVTNAYTDNSVTNGTTYYYVVSVVNAGGQGANSAQVSATPVLPSSIPSTPIGLSAAAGNAQVALSWTASTGATTYNVKKATVSGGPYTTIASSNTYSFTDNAVSNSTTYYYAVSAVNAKGESANSAQVSATPVNSIPSVPSGFTAIAGYNQVLLQWLYSGGGAISYNVKRSTISGGPYTTLGGCQVTVCVDPTVSSGITYYYVISAVNTKGESANSAQVSATPMSPPPGPSGLTATAGYNNVELTWTASTGAPWYNVKRATVSGGPYTTIASEWSGINYYDTSAIAGTTYYYVVSIDYQQFFDGVPSNGGGQSKNSAQVSVKPLPPPSGPVGLTAITGNGQVALSWTAASGNDIYTVLRSTVSGGPYTAIASMVNPNYIDLPVINGTTYYYVVSTYYEPTAVNAGGQSANSAQVSATPGAPSLPAVPVGLTATVSNTQVVLSWSPSTAASYYYVKRSTISGGPYTTIGSGYSGYIDNSVSNNTTYYYVVSAVNSIGQSANSAQVSATPLSQPPLAPTGLYAYAASNAVELSWNTSLGATSYNLKRATVSGGPYTTIASSVTNNSDYQDISVINGTTYYYVVSAVNAAGESPNSAQVSATPLSPPPAPVGLTATAGNAQVSLSWTASPGATDYFVFRSTVSGGPYTPIAYSLQNTVYTDSSVSNGTTYYYEVAAADAVGQSPNSTQVSATPMAPPSAPVGLNATTGNDQVALSWTASKGATSYNVKRSTVSGGPYTTIGSPATTNYTDISVSNGSTYYYVVSAVNAGGQSANSAQVSATPVAPPLAPTGLIDSASNAQVWLAWNNSTGATSYNVKRSTVSGGPYTAIASPANDVYTDTSVSNGITYYYVVSAVNAGGQSPNSAQISATPNAAPLAPGGLTATASNAKVTLSWTASTAATQYEVLRSTVSGGPYTTFFYTTATSYTDTTVTNGVTYYYVVSALDFYSSPYSTQVSAMPVAPPATPTGFTVIDQDLGRVILSWTPSTGAISYNIKRATVSGGPYTTIASLGVAASYTDTSVVSGTTYYYVISAANAGGQSANSAQVSATPVPPLATPAGLQATAGNAQVVLSWTASPGAAKYTVLRATVSGGPYTNLTTNDTTTTYTDSTVTNGTTYYYVVAAVNPDGNFSPYSNQASATPVI